MGEVAEFLRADPDEIEAYVRETAAAEGVDPDLAARIARAESGLNPSAVSKKGAVGVMQLMPATAKDYDANPYDWRENVAAGVKHFRRQLDRFQDIERALAAYNWGPEHVAAGGDWPEETRSYVRGIVGGNGKASEPQPEGEVAQFLAQYQKPKGEVAEFLEQSQEPSAAPEAPGLLENLGSAALTGLRGAAGRVASLPGRLAGATLRNLPLPGAPELAAASTAGARGVAEAIGPTPEQAAGVDTLAEKVAAGAGAAAIDLPKYALATIAAGGNPIAGFALADFLENADQGTLEALAAASKGATLGLILEKLRPFSRAVRAGGAGAAGGGMAALEGGTPQDIAASAITMGTLGGIGGKGKAGKVEAKPEPAPELQPEPKPKAPPQPEVYKERLWQLGERIRAGEQVPDAEISTLNPGDAEAFRKLAHEYRLSPQAEPAPSPVTIKRGRSGIEEVSAEFERFDSPDDYYYHVTTKPRVAKILREGFKPGVASSMAKGGAYEAYSKGKLFFSDRNAVPYWTERIQRHLEHDYENPPETTVLRFPKSLVTHAMADEIGARDSGLPSYYTEKPIVGVRRTPPAATVAPEPQPVTPAPAAVMPPAEALRAARKKAVSSRKAKITKPQAVADEPKPAEAPPPEPEAPPAEPEIRALEPPGAPEGSVGITEGERSEPAGAVAQREGVSEAAPAELPPVKRPWEERRDDYARENWQHELRRFRDRPDILDTKNRDEEIAHFKQLHLDAVAQAVERGDPVPAEVLADYPALAKKAAPPPPAQPARAEAKAEKSVPDNVRDRLYESARNDMSREERDYRSFSGADVANAPYYGHRRKFWLDLAEGKSFDEALAKFDADWREYANENNAKITKAPKLKYGPSSGQSSISYRYTNPDKVKADIPYLSSTAKQAGIPPPPAQPARAEAREAAAVEPPPAARAKEPWEVTSASLRDAVRVNDSADGISIVWPRQKGGLSFNPLMVKGRGEKAIANFHKRMVKAALREGRAVPPEVLAEYPELAKKPSAVSPELKAESRPLNALQAKTAAAKAKREAAAEKLKRKRTTAPEYLAEKVNYGGEEVTRGEMIADLQSKGTPEQVSAYLGGRAAREQRAHEAEAGAPAKNPALAETLRRNAKAMQKQIDEKRREMTQNPTPKRMKEYRSRLHDAANMERTQKAMLALADAHEKGTIPSELAGLRARSQIQNLVYKPIENRGYYAVVTSQEYGNKTPLAKALQDLMEKGPEAETPEVRAGKEKALKISQAEAEVQFAKIPGYFATPEPVVQKMLRAAEIRPGQSVLEPSAGKGDIADAIREQTPGADLSTVESQQRLANILELKGHKVVGSDFLEHAGQYDRIVMNPPFEKGSDIDHVRRAYDMLKPGGRVVAIMGEGSFFRTDKKATGFRDWLDAVGGESEKLPPQAFKTSGTGVASRMVTIEKPEGRFGSERGSFSGKPTEEAPYYVKRPSVLGHARDLLLKPGGEVIGAQGEPGRELKALIEKYRDEGDVAAGGRLAKLSDSGVANVKERADAFRLVDMLEGHAKAEGALGETAAKINELTNETATEAEQLGVLVEKSGKKEPFKRIAGYFPHVIRSVEQLASRRFGTNPIREDVTAGMVWRREFKNPTEATKFLNDYLDFAETGKRKKRLIDWMVSSGQARNELIAWQKLTAWRKRTNPRHGSLEFAREVNLPIWDPNPARVLPHWIAEASERLEMIKVFRQDTAGRMAEYLKAIEESGGDVDTVKRITDRILGVVNDSPGARKISRFVRGTQGFKLGLAAIPNATQTLNTLLYSDLRATLAGIGKAATKRGRRFAVESGASVDTVLNEMMREAGGDWRPLSRFLKAVGFTQTERMNRTIAANAGANYAGRLARRLHLNPRDATARRRLAELGIDAGEVAAQRGKLTPHQVLIAAKKLSDITQFRSRPEDLPALASDPWGKIPFQFKTFGYNQARLLKRTLYDEAKSGNYGRAARNVLILAAVFPLAGEAVADLRALLTGRKRDTKGFDRWLENIFQTGALGILSDMIQSAEYRRTLQTLAGPGISTISEIAESALQIVSAKDKQKAIVNFGKTLYKQVPLAGQLRRRLFPQAFPTKPAKGAVAKSPARRRIERQLEALR